MNHNTTLSLVPRACSQSFHPACISLPTSDLRWVGWSTSLFSQNAFPSCCLTEHNTTRCDGIYSQSSMPVHTHTHLHTHSHTCTHHTHTHTCTHSHLHTLTPAHTHTCTHSHLHTHTCTHSHLHTHTHTHTLTPAHTHTHTTLSGLCGPGGGTGRTTQCGSAGSPPGQRGPHIPVEDSYLRAVHLSAGDPPHPQRLAAAGSPGTLPQLAHDGLSVVHTCTHAYIIHIYIHKLIHTYIHTCCTYNMHVYKPCNIIHNILYVFAIAVNTSRVQ